MKQVVIVIGLAGIAAFIGYRYFMLNTKDSVVNHQKYLGNLSNPAEIYTSPSTGLLYSPFNIAVVQMDKLMLIDIEDDPEYTAIELQTFDDTRGQAARVLLYHHTGPADSYYTNQAFAVPDSGHDTSFLAPRKETFLDKLKSFTFFSITFLNSPSPIKTR